MSLLKRIEMGRGSLSESPAAVVDKSRSAAEIRLDLETQLNQQETYLRYEETRLGGNLDTKQREISLGHKARYETNIKRIKAALANLPPENAATAYHGQNSWGT